MKKIIAIAALVLVTGCGGSDRNPDPTEGNGAWTTVTTPDGRTCDIYSWSERSGGGYRGYGFAGMDCEERESE